MIDNCDDRRRPLRPRPALDRRDTAAGFDVLGLHWNVMEERATHYGVAVDRNAWRLVGLMHLAETREQAYKDVAHDFLDGFDDFQHAAAFPQMSVGDGTPVQRP